MLRMFEDLGDRHYAQDSRNPVSLCMPCHQTVFLVETGFLGPSAKFAIALGTLLRFSALNIYMKER